MLYSLVLEKFVFGKFLEKLPTFFRHFYTCFLVLISWVIFEAPNIPHYLAGMFGGLDIPLVSSQTVFYLFEYGFIFAAAILFCMPTAKFVSKKFLNFEKGPVQIFVSAAYLLVLLACTSYLVNSTYNPFLYFRF